MPIRRRGRGGVGSNQYQSRGYSLQRPTNRSADRAGVPTVVDTGLCAQVAGGELESGRKQCGEVWGMWCRHWVYPPSYSHGDHPTAGCKMDVATNPLASPELLEQLASDPQRYVRTEVANNPRTSPGVLERLAGDSEDWVRLAVAKSGATPSAALAGLASDPIPWVRRLVAEHPATPYAVLATLAMDSNLAVSTAALDNPVLPEHIRALVEVVRPPVVT